MALAFSFNYTLFILRRLQLHSLHLQHCHHCILRTDSAVLHLSAVALVAVPAADISFRKLAEILDLAFQLRFNITHIIAF